MRLFLAGIYTSNFQKTGRLYGRLTDHERKCRDEIENFLESYHYIYRQSFVEKIKRDNIKVFLDSGAFSAFTKGVDVDIKKYCDYIKSNKDIVDFCSVLDGIGDPDKTFENQYIMEQEGTFPLPCFHYGEDMRYLDYYVERYDYITLGGMVPISTPQLKFWLDRLWEKHLTDSDGKPLVKVHGFGLTSLPLMMRYPWYSVDSSTWVQWSANGMILVPGVGQINISAKSSSLKIAGQHIDNLPTMQREALEKHISAFGFEPDRLRHEYVARWIYNAWAFPYFAREKEYEGDCFIPEEISLF